MFNFKATIKKFAGLSTEDLRKLFSWSKQYDVFDGLNLLVGTATDENGPVAFVPVEPVFMLSNYVIRPDANVEAVASAGDAIDSAIIKAAQQQGIGRVLIVIPHGAPHQAGERTLRVIYRKVPQTQNIAITLEDGKTIEKLINIDPTTNTASWVN